MSKFDLIKKMLKGSTTMPAGTAAPSHVHYHDGVACHHDHSKDHGHDHGHEKHVHDENCNHDHHEGHVHDEEHEHVHADGTRCNHDHSKD